LNLGSCIGVVIRTGDKTFIGRIANLTAGLFTNKKMFSLLNNKSKML
jgi:magnesium-transporting ATPase (P-type)